jgi:hypothetical protein
MKALNQHQLLVFVIGKNVFCVVGPEFLTLYTDEF